MSGRRVLIVNADDFGRDDAITDGIVHAHEHGIVTSTSLMVRWPAAARAAARAAEHPALGVGLHLDLGEWRYEAGSWPAVYEVVDTSDAVAVEAQARAQLETFRRLLGRDPDHVDSHQHVHLHEPVARVARALAAELSVPLRHAPGIAYCGEFYGRTRHGDPYHEAITPEALAGLVDALGPGVTELSCHPGQAGETDPAYGVERVLELRALCDPRVRDAVERGRIELRTFGDVNRFPAQ